MIRLMMEILQYGNNDWWAFLAATHFFLRGGNPYAITVLGNHWLRVFEPPWTYALLSPFALLPTDVGRVAVFFTGLAVFGYSAMRMKAKPWQMGVFLLSEPVIGSLYQGNIDWLVTAGLWMPPQLGLFFVMMKPQIGVGVAIYWAAMAWKRGRWLELTRVFAPVTIAYLASFLVYGFWVENMADMNQNPVSVSIFPLGLVLAAVLILRGINREEQNLAAIGSPFAAPYITINNFSSVLLSAFDRPRLFLTAWIILWIPTVVRMFIRG